MLAQNIYNKAFKSEKLEQKENAFEQLISAIGKAFPGSEGMLQELMGLHMDTHYIICEEAFKLGIRFEL
jgi:ribosomal protein S7